MRRQDRQTFYESMPVAASDLLGSDLEAKYLPPWSMIADSELAKMGEKGRAELERRERLRQEHVKAGRVRYVFQTKGFSSDIWVMSTAKKGQERDQHGHLKGHSVQSPREGVQLAMMSLERHDEGGVVYVDAPDWYSIEAVVDLRPTECVSVLQTGRHDWFDCPTGDDVCRSCGLVA